jgi:CRISPR-associated endonuclease/helicase Cas3
VNPDRDAVIIGTIDVLLSRALNRGYGTSRFSWPIDFGLLNSGAHWVFDETQLLGPALATSRQLQAMRDRFGTVGATGSTWMSATVDRRSLSTVDSPFPGDRDAELVLGDDDRNDSRLSRRLRASRRVHEVSAEKKGREQSLANAALELHRPGTLTLVVVNQVKTAQAVYQALTKIGSTIPCHLVHGQFRPLDRDRLTALLFAPSVPSAPNAPGAGSDQSSDDGVGRIVVATQVVEAGLDISAATLLTEAAPWPSIVQRTGRCNRDGLASDAVLAWVSVEADRVAPYPADDVAAAEVALRGLEGREVTTEELASMDVDVSQPEQPVLRRSDLLDLFDTVADLSGNDVDVGPFIRDGDERDIYVGWADLEAGGSPTVAPPPASLCRVPLTKSNLGFLVEHGWRVDTLAVTSRRGAWRRISGGERLRPGEVIVLPSTAGGYDEAIGWTPSIRTRVTTVTVPDTASPTVDHCEEEYGSDIRSLGRVWVPLRQHLEDVEREVRLLSAELDLTGLDAPCIEAAAIAGRLHDLGKAHPVFQSSMVNCADEEDREQRVLGIPWAKSGSTKRLVHERPAFRHELASALALLGEADVLLRGVERSDLVVYLVAAHHGRVRLGIRSVQKLDDDRYILGVEDGDRLPALEVPGGQCPPAMLSLDVVRMGRDPDTGRMSWSERSLRLLDELGPFKLGFLEALVRVADWRASAGSEASLSTLPSLQPLVSPVGGSR